MYDNYAPEICKELNTNFKTSMVKFVIWLPIALMS